ncbi:MAG: hypothetical protein VYB46_15100 [Pseudomonadota bacterium]|nr:hypothetical protein [Pseudomonadota bacterium]
MTDQSIHLEWQPEAASPRPGPFPGTHALCPVLGQAQVLVTADEGGARV